MADSTKRTEADNATLGEVHAREGLEAIATKAGPFLDRLTAITALLAGNLKGRVRQSPDGVVFFDVYLPGQCTPESFVLPTAQDIASLVDQRQQHEDNLAAAEAILKRHGRRSPLAIPERPQSRQRFMLVSERLPEDE